MRGAEPDAVHEQYMRVQAARRVVVREAERVVTEGCGHESLALAVVVHRQESEALNALLALRSAE